MKNRRGKDSTSCFVSGRWVRFGPPANHVGGTVVVAADIMTETEAGDRKLCEFYFDLNELEAIVQRLKSNAVCGEAR
jgi:hypothetical protein